MRGKKSKLAGLSNNAREILASGESPRAVLKKMIAAGADVANNSSASNNSAEDSSIINPLLGTCLHVCSMLREDNHDICGGGGIRRNKGDFGPENTRKLKNGLESTMKAAKELCLAGPMWNDLDTACKQMKVATGSAMFGRASTMQEAGSPAKKCRGMESLFFSRGILHSYARQSLRIGYIRICLPTLFFPENPMP